MKADKEKKEVIIENTLGLELTTNDALNKYKALEFTAPKLQDIQKKFSKPVIIHR